MADAETPLQTLIARCQLAAPILGIGGMLTSSLLPTPRCEVPFTQALGLVLPWAILGSLCMLGILVWLMMRVARPMERPQDMEEPSL